MEIIHTGIWILLMLIAIASLIGFTTDPELSHQLMYLAFMKISLVFQIAYLMIWSIQDFITTVVQHLG